MPIVFHTPDIPVFVIFILFASIVLPNIFGLIDSEVIRRASRWKRQVVPSDHLQVYSLNSSITRSMTEDTEVNSPESRIEIQEQRFNSTIWSAMSTVLFDPQQEYINLTAQDIVATFTLNRAQFETYANQFRLNETTRRFVDGHTNLLVALQNNINLSFTDTTPTRIEAVNGRMAVITGNSWEVVVQRRLDLFSSLVGNERQLAITAINNDYNIQITLLGAQVALSYGEVRVEISADYRRLVLTSRTHRVELATVRSPFNLSITDQELTVRCPDDTTTVRILRDSQQIDIEVSQLSTLHVDRSEGSQFSIGSQLSTLPERLELSSLELSLQLNSREQNSQLYSLIRALSNTSELIIQTNITRSRFKARHHLIDILGGTPHLYLDTGNITLDISTNQQGEGAVTLLPAFTTPRNQFANIGPFDSGTLIIGNNGNQNQNQNGMNENNSNINGNGNNGNNNMNNGSTGNGNINENTGNGNGSMTSSRPTGGLPGGNLNGQPETDGFPEPNTNLPDLLPTNLPPIVTSTTVLDSIADDFPRPNASIDSFSFQQFGEDITPAQGFPISATINTIIMPQATTLSESRSSSSLSNSDNVFTGGVSKRDVNHRNMLELHLQVNDTVKLREKRFLKNLEDSLSTIAKAIIIANTSDDLLRKKRNLEDVKIKIDKAEPSKDHPNDVSVLFYVDQPEDFNELPLLATKLNDVGMVNLTQKLGYPVVSEVTLIQYSKNIIVVIAIAASSVLCILLILFMGWQCKIREKRVMAYLRRSRVSDSTVEINRAPISSPSNA